MKHSMIDHQIDKTDRSINSQQMRPAAAIPTAFNQHAPSLGSHRCVVCTHTACEATTMESS